MSLSVVIPAHDEEQQLRSTLARISHYLADQEIDFEIIVVDDGSTDRTALAALAADASNCRVLRVLRNRGKGAAVRIGVLASHGDAILICDADLATPIEDLARLRPHLPLAPVVLGSRRVDSAGITQAHPAARRMASRGLNRVLRSFGLCRGIRDAQCGFKLLDGQTGRDLFRQMEIDGFGFDIELVALAQHIGLPIREVGVTWSCQGVSRVRLIPHSIGILREAIRVRNRLRGTGAREFRSLSDDEPRDPSAPRRRQS